MRSFNENRKNLLKYGIPHQFKKATERHYTTGWSVFRQPCPKKVRYTKLCLHQSGWPKNLRLRIYNTLWGYVVNKKWRKPMVEECSSPRRKASTSLAKKSCPNWSVRRRKVAVSWPARYTSRAGTPDTFNKSCQSGLWIGTCWLQIQPLRKERNSKTIF